MRRPWHGMSDGECEIWNEMQRDAAPTQEEMIADFVGKHIEDITDDDRDAWLDHCDAEAERMKAEIDRINAEAAEDARRQREWYAEQGRKEREREAAYRAALAACGDDGLF